MLIFKKQKSIFLLTLLLVNFGCSGLIISSKYFYTDRQLGIYEQIEKRGIYLANPIGIKNVYYLAKIDSLTNNAHVGYFIEWEKEHPDFGTHYKTTLLGIMLQVIVPIFYTNWIYLPKSGGIVYLLYGKHDVEGIFAIYDCSENSLNKLKFIAFEFPNHKECQIPNEQSTIQIHDVAINYAPFLEVASWNHRFRIPINKRRIQHFTHTLRENGDI